MLLLGELLVCLLKLLLQLECFFPQAFDLILSLHDLLLSQDHFCVCLFYLCLPLCFCLLQFDLCLHDVPIKIFDPLFRFFVVCLFAADLSLEHFLKKMIGEQSIAFVADTMLLLVKFRKLSVLTAAIFTDHLAAAPAVVFSNEANQVECLAA